MGVSEAQKFVHTLRSTFTALEVIYQKFFIVMSKYQVE